MIHSTGNTNKRTRSDTNSEYPKEVKQGIGPLARNCRWTLLTQLTDRF